MKARFLSANATGFDLTNWQHYISIRSEACPRRAFHPPWLYLWQKPPWHFWQSGTQTGCKPPTRVDCWRYIEWGPNWRNQRILTVFGASEHATTWQVCRLTTCPRVRRSHCATATCRILWRFQVMGHGEQLQDLCECRISWISQFLRHGDQFSNIQWGVCHLKSPTAVFWVSADCEEPWAFNWNVACCCCCRWVALRRQRVVKPQELFIQGCIKPTKKERYGSSLCTAAHENL